jgi:hypothetical protein
LIQKSKELCSNAGAKVIHFLAFANVSQLFFGSFLQLIGFTVFAGESFFDGRQTFNTNPV